LTIDAGLRDLTIEVLRAQSLLSCNPGSWAAGAVVKAGRAYRRRRRRRWEHHLQRANCTATVGATLPEAAHLLQVEQLVHEVNIPAGQRLSSHQGGPTRHRRSGAGEEHAPSPSAGPQQGGHVPSTNGPGWHRQPSPTPMRTCMQHTCRLGVCQNRGLQAHYRRPRATQLPARAHTHPPHVRWSQPRLQLLVEVGIVRSPPQPLPHRIIQHLAVHEGARLSTSLGMGLQHPHCQPVPRQGFAAPAPAPSGACAQLTLRATAPCHPIHRLPPTPLKTPAARTPCCATRTPQPPPTHFRCTATCTAQRTDARPLPAPRTEQAPAPTHTAPAPPAPAAWPMCCLAR